MKLCYHCPETRQTVKGIQDYLESEMGLPLADREASADAIIWLLKDTVGFKRCRKHYTEPPVHLERNKLDHMPFMDDYMNPVSDEKAGME